MSIAPYLQGFLPLPLALLVFNSHAQAVPDAGALRQQLEQGRELTLPPADRPARVLNPAQSEPKAGATVNVKAFRFEGNQLLGTEALNAVVASYLERPLAFEDLQGVPDLVAAAYRRAGWLAQVSLPAQDITEGVVALVIVESQYAGLRLETQLSARVNNAVIEGVFAHHQQVGAPLNTDQLDRALLLADDVPGVSVAGTLVPGERDGETALLLRSTDELPYYGEVTLDNTGSRSTGSERLSLNLNLNSPSGRGELVSLSLMHSQGSDYGRVAATVPVGHSGLRVGVSASDMRYEVIDGPASNTTAQIKGQSSSFGLDLSYPWVRARSHNVYLSAALENKAFRNEDSEVRSDYESSALQLGVSGNRFDSWGGGGANSASLQWRSGELTDMRAHTQIDDIRRRFHKISYSLTRQQAINAEHSLLFTLSGQHATEALDSSEKFYIGGAQSVRAYPVSELGGERGQALSAEWRWRPSTRWVLTAFAGVGRVVSLPMTSSDQTTAHTLRGGGLSVGWQGPMGLNARLTWAQRIGENPKPTSTGTDSDGTLRKNRFWLSTSLPF